MYRGPARPVVLRALAAAIFLCILFAAMRPAAAAQRAWQTMTDPDYGLAAVAVPHTTFEAVGPLLLVCDATGSALRLESSVNVLGEADRRDGLIDIDGRVFRVEVAEAIDGYIIGALEGPKPEEGVRPLTGTMLRALARGNTLAIALGHPGRDDVVPLAIWSLDGSARAIAAVGRVCRR